MTQVDTQGVSSAMIAASTITSTDTATVPFSRPSGDLGSAPSSDEVGPESVRTVVPKARLERMAAEGPSPASSSAPVSSLAPNDMPAASADASGARLIIPAVSLRDMLSDPTPEGRMASLHEIRAIDITPPANETRTDLLSRREATISVERAGLRVRVSTAMSLGVGAVIVLLGLAFSTTDLAATLAARIHLATADEPIPAATAEVAVATVTAPPAPPAPIETEISVAPVATVAAPAVAAPAEPARPKTTPHASAPRPSGPRMIRSMPVRLRSPY